MYSLQKKVIIIIQGEPMTHEAKKPEKKKHSNHCLGGEIGCDCGAVIHNQTHAEWTAYLSHLLEPLEKANLEEALEVVGFLMRKGKDFEKMNSKNSNFFYDRANSVQILIDAIQSVIRKHRRKS